MLDNIDNEINKNLTTLFNVSRAIKAIIKKTTPILQTLTVSSTKESLEVIETGYVAESWFERNARISREYSERISESINTLDKDLKEDVRRSLARNATRDRNEQLEQLLKDTSNKFDSYYTKERANMIARTNTNAVDNNVKRDTWTQEGVTELEWVTEGDDRVRDSHEAMDGKRISVSGSFDVNGDSMQFPAGGSVAGENVNCRCTMLPIKR